MRCWSYTDKNLLRKEICKNGGRDEYKWMRVMAARRRKTLIVCQSCHNSIHYSRYDGTALSKQVTGELRETEIAHA